MNDKRISIDVEVIKKPKIYEFCCIEASAYEHHLPETVSKPSKWQSLKNEIKNKIIRYKDLKKNKYIKNLRKE